MTLYRIIINTVDIIIFVRLIFVYARLSENILTTKYLRLMVLCILSLLLYDYYVIVWLLDDSLLTL